MIIDCIGCLHGVRPKLEGGDILIVTGDLTSHDEPEQYLEFGAWLSLQNYNKKILIAGNHDNFFIKDPKLGCAPVGFEYSLNRLDNRIEYLYDSGTEFEGLKIWGSPWTAQFKGINPKCTAFTIPYDKHTDDRLNDYWEKIPLDTDILITHGPPFNILDNVKDRECDCGYDCSIPTGSKSLIKKVLEVKPKLHVFSHIHEQGGQEYILKRPGYDEENNTRFVNCSIMSDNYRPDNQPVRVYL